MTPAPPSVVADPPGQWDRSAPPAIYPDPGVVVVDPAFDDMLLDLTAIRRVWTGSQRAEGPASGQGQFLVFSDVRTNAQRRCNNLTKRSRPRRAARSATFSAAAMTDIRLKTVEVALAYRRDGRLMNCLNAGLLREG
jgi:hypothetical protein